MNEHADSLCWVTLFSRMLVRKVLCSCDLLLASVRPVSAGVTRSRGGTVDENEALTTPDD